MAPKGQAVTHVSQHSHLSDMTRTLTGCSLKNQFTAEYAEGRAGTARHDNFILHSAIRVPH
jgi:hypothetical protein